MTLKKTKTNGLRDIVISAATAGWERKTNWKFNGKTYAKAKGKQK